MGNVDVVRALYDCWERGDFAGGASLVTTDLQFARKGTAFGILEGEWCGAEDAWQAALEWLRSWRELRIEVEDVIELDDERVLVLDRQFGRGATSDVSLEIESAWVFTVHDGKITRMDGYLPRAAALAATGLTR
jgi:ketosteroid isomerase-like protein